MENLRAKRDMRDSFCRCITVLADLWLCFGWAPACLHSGDIEIREGGYKFINPLLDCDSYVEAPELTGVRSKVVALIEAKKVEGKLEFASVYFRGLMNGPWFGINEKEEYSPGSLIKVPLMMGILKRAEAEPSFLSQKILFSRKIDLVKGQRGDPSKFIKIGETYTVDDLARRMIAYSDNQAMNLLTRLMDESRKKVKKDGEPARSISFLTHFADRMTVKSYSAFFRVLYNSSYLNRQMSEKALDYLSQSDFKSGLAAGVPQSVVVAHKFGERAKGDVTQLHDCGIVYHKDYPYILFVMTRGTDYHALEKTIAEISSLVYHEVDRQMREERP